MMTRKDIFISKFFKDHTGNIVLFQRPNIPLLGWIILTTTGVAMPQEAVKNIFGLLGSISLLIWAVLEILQGVNYFRKLLGLAAVAALVVGLALQ